MKVSIVTVVLNCAEFIAGCIQSVLQQQEADIEYIVIDGGSSDGTIEIISQYLEGISIFISEKDEGYYSALNRGIQLATGDIVGVLNADDILADPYVISCIIGCFSYSACDAIYGNLVYTARHNINVVIRNWRSNSFLPSSIKYGWMPPHPTLYLRKEVFHSHGLYARNFGLSADYDMIIRLFSKKGIRSVFLDRLIVRMRSGGVSNRGVKQLWMAVIADYKVLVFNQVSQPFVALAGKKIRKLKQFI
ncbi:glycosyltransferase family 2 protein [Pedobacter sp.]|uniref:glycosyltransferase family 2 protein n=1 Tax=Pedobacter sp. TaxID=1411316 RepID=UPI003D7FCF02